MEFLTLANALNGAILLAAGFGWRWMDRLQKQQDEAQKFKESVLENYAKKAEVRGSRDEVLAELAKLSVKLDKMTDKLDAKKDKSDG